VSRNVERSLFVDGTCIWDIDVYKFNSIQFEFDLI